MCANYNITVHTPTHTHTHIYTHIYRYILYTYVYKKYYLYIIYMWIYMYICNCYSINVYTSHTGHEILISDFGQAVSFASEETRKMGSCLKKNFN